MKDISCIERSSSKFHNERGLESYYNMFCEVFVYALFIMFIICFSLYVCKQICKYVMK